MLLSRRLTAFTALLLLSASAWAQNNIASPYTSIGLGLQTKPVSTRNLSMGGASIGSFGFLNINAQNPASYSDLAFTTLDVGLTYRTAGLTSETAQSRIRSGGLQGFTIGFAGRRQPHFVIGLQPFTSIDYNIRQFNVLPLAAGDTAYYNATSIGSGGLNKVFLGVGGKIIGGLSLGANFSYIFGTIKQEDVTDLANPDGTNIPGTQVGLVTNYSIGGINFDLGLNYTDTLRRDKDYPLLGRIGLTYRGQATLGSTKRSELLSRTGQGVVRDTLEEGKSDDISVPSSYGIGIGLARINKYEINAEFQYSNWSNLDFDGRSDSLRASWSFAIGGEYIPDVTSLSYFNQIAYRAGFRYDNTYLVPTGADGSAEPLSSFSITAGLALPLPRNFSKINLGIEYGILGKASNGLFRENFIVLSMGLHFNERWFVRRVFD